MDSMKHIDNSFFKMPKFPQGGDEILPTFFGSALGVAVLGAGLIEIIVAGVTGIALVKALKTVVKQNKDK